jgi:hypothetical protein
VVSVQDESQHSVPSSQALSQLPQFALSVAWSTQALSQQAGLSPSLQAVPQSPQLEASVVTSVQVPSVAGHSCWPVSQLALHLPAEQISVSWQALSQAPQFELSVLVSTQSPLQLV